MSALNDKIKENELEDEDITNAVKLLKSSTKFRHN